MLSLVASVVAAVVEVAGDAAIRQGFTGAPEDGSSTLPGLLVVYEW